jgi:hypothetical protein
LNDQVVSRIQETINDFLAWLASYGETSQDHQDFYAGNISRRAKALYYRRPVIGALAVAPMVLCEAFAPQARVLFHSPARIPIADAHYAMGFALMSRVTKKEEYYNKAVHFLEVLKQTRCPGYRHHGWGYPFHWQTRGGLIRAGTPLITTTPYCYEAFQYVFDIDGGGEWLEVMHSIADHAATDIKDFEISPGVATCSYTPHDGGGVINASAYRGFLLTSASVQFSEKKYLELAERNLNFVLQSQQADGAWLYASDSARDFIDHFHTCFVLKALAKIEKITAHKRCVKAIENGVRYYIKNLFDEKGLPKPFSRPPRLTVYRHELYDYAECINLCLLLRNRFGELDEILGTVLEDLMIRWRKGDGSFRSRQLLFGWDNVPMHRWGQSQVFRSLCFLLSEERGNS